MTALLIVSELTACEAGWTHTTMTVMRNPASTKKMPIMFMWGMALLNRQTHAQESQVAILNGVRILSLKEAAFTRKAETYNICHKDVPWFCFEIRVGYPVHLNDGVCFMRLASGHECSVGSIPKMKFIDASPKTHASQFQ
jgi:hypothetical protein